MAEEVIRVAGLGKSYETAAGRFPALQNVDLCITAGEFVAIMGPSGSGKSTFMNLLGCLDTPSSGDYFLVGRNVAQLRQDELARLRNRSIGFVFQGFNLLPRMTLTDNVALPLVYAGIEREQRRQRARHELTRVGLGDYADALPSRISGGQQQRVAIARALINSPQLILADEPTGNLDSQTSEEIMALFTALNREGISIVLVTHEPDIAVYAARQVRFRDGRLVSDLPTPRQSDRRMLKAMLGEAWQAMGANRMRSMLTMLGMVIGVGSVVLMMAIGQGAQYAVAQTISSMGSNLYILISGSTSAGGLRSGGGGGPTLTVADGEAIAELDGVSNVAPVQQGTQQLVYGANNWSATVVGTTPPYLDARAWTIVSGYPFGDSDVRAATRVALIGQTAADNLFGNDDPLGKTIRIRQSPFVIVGVLGKKGQNLDGRDQDDTVIIPLTTAQRKVFGNPFPGSVRLIMVQATSAEAMPAVEKSMTALLRQRHRIREGQDNDFYLRNLAAAADSAAETTRVMSVLLGAIASVSLLVGGIGIMNIMLVSVTERTREIGIRMAIGARQQDILAQFLLEALMISVAGCLIGLFLGIGGALLTNALTDMVIVISGASILVAFGVAAGIGIFFGYYPAHRAAALDPIEALRHQ